MTEPSDPRENAVPLRDKIIGLGERSLRKSYYPQLRQRLDELEESHRSLEERSAALQRMLEDLEKARGQLAGSEQRQRLALHIGRIGAFEVDLASGGGDWTPEMETIWGLPLGTVADPVALCWDHVHPDDIARARQLFAAALESGEPGKTELRIVRPDGEVRWIVWHGQVLRDPDKESRRVVGVVMDITEQRVAAAAVASAAAEWRATFDAMSDSVALFDADGRVVRCNTTTTELTGLPLDEIVGRPCNVVFGCGDARPAACPQIAAVESGRCETSVFERGGRWLRFTYRPLFDEDGRLTSGVHVVSDITGLKQTEQQVQQLNATLEARVAERTRELEAANRELEAFSYSVSHDLRAPLRAINGFTEIVVEDCGEALGEENMANLDRVRAAARRMGELIDALLGLSRIARRELTLRDVDLSALARSLVAELQAAEPERQVAVTVGDGLIARGDPRLLEVVLRNLLSNAWKYTGGLEAARIEVDRLETTGSSTFFVRDNGVGFDPEHAESIFQPFRRLHVESEFPGMGIGLATVRRAIGRHGGQCWAEGIPGEGAAFFFTLPAVSAYAESRRFPHDEALRSGG